MCWRPEEPVRMTVPTHGRSAVPPMPSHPAVPHVHPDSGRSGLARSAPAGGGEDGIALILALIFSILLYILVAELVVSGRMIRATGENDALLARMRNQMVFQLAATEEDLLTDLGGQAAGDAGGLGGLGGASGGAGGPGNPLQGAGGGSGGGGGAAGADGGAGAEGGGEESDPAADCDSSRDAWFQATGHADNDLTTYVMVEDENRKFNILSLWSPDEKFAEFSRDRLVRLIDVLREDSEFDVSTGDAERIVQDLKDWVGRPGTDAIPRPRLKSDDEKHRDVTAIMHLDELMMLPSVSEDLFFDKVLDGHYYPGLESVLTIWTSLRKDPGDPQKVARQRARAQINGQSGSQTGGGNSGGDNSGGGNSGGGKSGGGASSGGDPAGSGAPGGDDAPIQPDGIGIRININTAPRAVLRALFPADKIPDRVIDAIIKYRNEVDEEAMKADEADTGESVTQSDFGDLRLGADTKRKFFATAADLDNVEEWKELQDDEIKSAFQNAITTKSEVFTINLATLYKRNEETRLYLLRRARSIVLRVDDGADGQIVPLVPFEERTGLRLMPVDVQQDAANLGQVYAEMDQFAQEERAWNPFLVDFYMPTYSRDEFYRPR